MLHQGCIEHHLCFLRRDIPAPQAIWSTAKLGRDRLINSVVTAIFSALLIEKPNAACAELSCIRRGMFAWWHKGHPWRVLLSCKPGAVHSAAREAYAGTWPCTTRRDRSHRWTGKRPIRPLSNRRHQSRLRYNRAGNPFTKRPAIVQLNRAKSICDRSNGTPTECLS